MVTDAQRQACAMRMMPGGLRELKLNTRLSCK
jgi:hypothetical protein